MRRLYSLEEFARLADSDSSDVTTDLGIATTASAPPEWGDDGEGERVVSYVFSTPAVGRDRHTVAAGAWQTGNFLKNPVFLWAHDDTSPPIGRVVDINEVNGVLRGSVEYADADLNPFADTIYRMVKAGYINAVSTSWQPLDWSFSKDKDRMGGIDFKKVELLEISQVPIPALPAALAEARSVGINTAPLYEWAERLLDTGGLIAVPRDELVKLRRSAKMPAAAKSKSEAESRKVKAREALRALGDALAALSDEEVTELMEVADKRGLLLVRSGDGEDVPPGHIEQLKRCADHHERALKHHRNLGEHHDAASEHLQEAGDAHDRVTKTLEQIGVHVRAAQNAINGDDGDGDGDDDGDDGDDGDGKDGKSRSKRGGEPTGGKEVDVGDPAGVSIHLKRALKAHQQATDAHGDVGDAHDDLKDRHEDVGDCHRAAHRSVKSAQRCVRAVLDQGEGAKSSEPDDTDKVKDDGDDKDDAERAARKRRLKLILLRKPA